MYSSIDDIQDRIPEDILIQLTDDAGAGTVDATKVDAAITRADSLIDAQCRGRYTVPFAVIPPVIAATSADLAVYFIYARRQEIIPEARTDQFKAAQQLLRDIASGKVRLDSPEAEKTGTTSGAKIVSGGDRIFTGDSLKGGF